MESLLKETVNVVDKLYTNFIHRDLVYITSGAMVLLMGLLSLGLVHHLLELPRWFIAFVFLSGYYIGLLNQELWVLTKLFKLYPDHSGKNFIEQESKALLKLIKITEANEQTTATKVIERIIVIKTIAASFGSALISSLIIFSISIYWNKDTTYNELELHHYILIITSTLVLVFTTIKVNRAKTLIQHKLISELTAPSH